MSPKSGHHNRPIPPSQNIQDQFPNMKCVPFRFFQALQEVPVPAVPGTGRRGGTADPADGTELPGDTVLLLVFELQAEDVLFLLQRAQAVQVQGEGVLRLRTLKEEKGNNATVLQLLLSNTAPF